MELAAELRALAVQEDLSAVLVRRLLQHRGARSSVALLRRDLTDELLAEIVDLGSVRTLAANSSLPSRIRARFAQYPDPAVRRAVAASVPDAPRGLLARLAADPDPSVRSFLAMNEHLSTELLALLAADSEPSVRSSVIQRWGDVPDDVRRMLLTVADPSIRSGSVRAFAPPVDLLPGLLEDPVTRAAAVARAVPTPELAADPDSDVREAIAAHLDLPPGLRDLLAGDRDIFVRNTIAARPETPRALREHVVATLEPSSPVAQRRLLFSRGTHTCPPAAPAPPKLSRQQAESLLARAGL
ncbi:hypothetical protein [Streptomyces sp. NPDC102282]|uniref:hypothetical protein n=1 Tax=Streptomyces sp. NPDC102282 TaxID=3366154 RepID=UPI0038188C17